MIKSKKQMYIVISVFALILLLGTTTYAFFNYTRTGVSNTIKVGRISFNSTQNGNINLTNVFPIKSEDAENDGVNAKSVSITITGDTDYSGGVEYVLTASDVNMTVNGKQLPVSLEVTVAGNNNKTLGTLETGNYYTNRDNYSISKYKIEYDGELEEGAHILVGYIAPNTTSGTAEGVDGIITIKAYIDADRVFISDTYDGTESDNMGTTNAMVGNRVVFTTQEWNSIQSAQSPLSFKVKVEANEGIWVREPITLRETITRKVGTANYIASYDDVIAEAQAQNLTFTTQDQVSTSATKQTVYYYTGNDASANSNVLFAGYCWQIVRTTDNGGVKLLYNGVPKKLVAASIPISSTDITYTNDSTYPYTYDNNTKKWTSANAGVSNTTDTFIFTVNTAGDYAINYTVSSQANYDQAKFYINNVLLGQHSGEEEGVFDLGTLVTTDVVKIEYYKNWSTDTGNDNIVFDIANVISRSDTLACSNERKATKGINGTGNNGTGTSTSLAGATLFGKSYDYNLETGQFTIKNMASLPTAWSENDTNLNGKKDYEELIGTYTCLSNSDTCTTLYYIGSYASGTNAYTAHYTIGDVAHYSQMGKSPFNANYMIPALVGYMFNKEYENNYDRKSGEYYSSAIWNGTVYELSNGNSGTSPDATHHYICDSDCTKVRYYHFDDLRYIILENGKTVEDALKEMINYKVNISDSDENINVYNSAIKGYLDNWYKKNLTAYSNYLANDTVFCNDRSVRNLGGWNSNGINLTGDLQFYQYSANRDLNCVNETDRFSKSNSKAKLEYPIGLLTEPERNLMTANFAKTGQQYLSLSPLSFSSGISAYMRIITEGGGNIYYNVSGIGVRAVITLKPGTKLESGTGAYTDPYIVGPIVTRDN